MWQRAASWLAANAARRSALLFLFFSLFGNAAKTYHSSTTTLFKIQLHSFFRAKYSLHATSYTFWFILPLRTKRRRRVRSSVPWTCSLQRSLKSRKGLIWSWVFHSIIWEQQEKSLAGVLEPCWAGRLSQVESSECGPEWVQRGEPNGSRCQRQQTGPGAEGQRTDCDWQESFLSGKLKHILRCHGRYFAHFNSCVILKPISH